MEYDFKKIDDRFIFLKECMMEETQDDFDAPLEQVYDNFEKTKQALLTLFHTMKDPNNPAIGLDYYGKCEVEWHRTVEQNVTGEDPKFFGSSYVHVYVTDNNEIRITKWNINEKGRREKTVALNDIIPDIMEF
jgi:hypothetical protein